MTADGSIAMRRWSATASAGTSVTKNIVKQCVARSAVRSIAKPNGVRSVGKSIVKPNTANVNATKRKSVVSANVTKPTNAENVKRVSLTSATSAARRNVVKR